MMKKWLLAVFMAGAVCVGAERSIPQVEYTWQLPADSSTRQFVLTAESLEDNQVWIKLENVPAGELQIGSYAEGAALVPGPVLSVDATGSLVRLPLRSEIVTNSGYVLNLGYVNVSAPRNSCYVRMCAQRGKDIAGKIHVLAAVVPGAAGKMHQLGADLRAKGNKQVASVKQNPALGLDYGEAIQVQLSSGNDSRRKKAIQVEIQQPERSVQADSVDADSGNLPVLIVVGVLLALSVWCIIRRFIRTQDVVITVRCDSEQNCERFIKAKKIRRSQQYTLGRSSQCSLRLSGRTISAIHGQLLFAGAQLQYIDLGSTNGSCRNGVPLKPYIAENLAAGDKLTLGTVTITITW